LKENREIYILDTSALLTYIEDENGSDYVENLLIKAEKEEVLIYIAFISLTEVFYITAKEKDESEALRRIMLIQSLSVRIVESDENLNIAAGKLKAKNIMSLADAYKRRYVKNIPEYLSIKTPNLKKCHL
jgi:hypothetical protein